jgi:hypothetical protein
MGPLWIPACQSGSKRMSVIAIVITEPGPKRARLIASIHRATGLGISAIGGAIDGKGALLQRELFLRDHAEVAATLRSLTSLLADAGASYEIYELPSGSSQLTVADDHDKHRISTRVLERILAGREEGLKEQQRIVDRELEEEGLQDE